jgi:hypothetical protein
MNVIFNFNDEKFSERNTCDQEVELPAVPRIGETIDYRDEPITDESGAMSKTAKVTDVIWHLVGDGFYVVCECEILWNL